MKQSDREEKGEGEDGHWNEVIWKKREGKGVTDTCKVGTSTEKINGTREDVNC